MPQPPRYLTDQKPGFFKVNKSSIFKGAIPDDGSKHTISKEEQRSFAQWINGHFAEVNLQKQWNQILEFF